MDVDMVASTESTLARIRVALLWTVVLGMLGTAVELLLIGHIEDVAQWIPLALLATGIVVTITHARRPTRVGVRILQAVMAACVAAGILGVALHYRGNLEFELEMYPTMTGPELWGKVATGATPVLAPGAMTLLGVVGLLHAYRHPARAGAGREEGSES